MAINDDIKITINLNELVETRAKLLTQYNEGYSEKIVKGEYLDENEVDSNFHIIIYRHFVLSM